MEYLYRFRSIESLLEKHQELEKQEIYFPSFDQLNDPMEGFQDMFWSGDQIVWKNLLKHYLLCLEQVYALFILGGNNVKIDSNSIPICSTESHLPTQEYKNLYKEICEKFFDNSSIAKYPEFLLNRKVPLRRNELLFYLRVFHYHAINVILTVHEHHHHIQRPVDDPLRTIASTILIDPEKLRSINELENQHPDIKGGADKLYAIACGLTSQIDLIDQYNGIAAYNDPNAKFVFLEFPEKYIKQLEKIAYADWYTACFSRNCNNSSMWGHYGDHHKGVCLKFRTAPAHEEPSITLHGIVGWGGSKKQSGPRFGSRPYRFHKVNYAKKYPEIDFFRSLGRLPVPALHWWYMDEQGNKSSCMGHILENTDRWRERYWLTLHERQTTKLEDWAYEEEYRLVLNPMMIDYSDPAYRKLKYDFNELSGIIFGINTSMEDKFRILKIMEAKCKQHRRSNFAFFQGSYVKETGKIEAVEMPLVKFKL